MSVAKNIGRYMKEKGYNLSEVSRKIGIGYKGLYTSLFDEERNRDLRAEELIRLCEFLDVDPREFVGKTE